jgi:hypothetical protein
MRRVRNAMFVVLVVVAVFTASRGVLAGWVDSSGGWISPSGVWARASACDAYAYTGCNECEQYPESECDNLCSWFNTVFNPTEQCDDWVYSQSGPSCIPDGQLCRMQCTCSPDEY